MTPQESAQQDLNGFKALTNAEKRWFLIRVRELPRTTAAHERPAISGRAVV